jgi:TonB family protein
MRNRIYLILTMLLPVFIPLLKIPVNSNIAIPVRAVNVLNTGIFSGNAPEAVRNTATIPFSYYTLFIWIYFTIAGLLLLKTIISLTGTLRIIKKGTVKSKNFPKIIISTQKHPTFSFFPFAVIPAEDYQNPDYAGILDHEFAHIKQGHTFDLLLSELYITFQWFNPIAWLIKRSIILNHEYLADHASLGKSRSVRDYQYKLLNFQTGLNKISLAHNFNNSIKNRIVMINKKSTSGIAAFKNLLLLPLLALVLYSFTRPEQNSATRQDNSISRTGSAVSKEIKGIVKQQDGKPLESATIVIKGTTIGTSSDVKGSFRLSNVPDEAVLIVSYIGFETKAVKPDFNSEMTITMTRQTVNTGIVSITPPPPPPPSDKKLWAVVEEMPMFPGGEQAMISWISSNIIYPAEAVKAGIQGIVPVHFMVTGNGKVKYVRVSKSVNHFLDAEAVKVISTMPDWKPGRQNGKPVDVDFTVPVEFKLK